jgi:hypothetical protein
MSSRRRSGWRFQPAEPTLSDSDRDVIFEAVRRELLERLTANPRDRAGLEAEYGQVWDERQLAADFEVMRVRAPYLLVRRKADGQVGGLHFQNDPRFYFRFLPLFPEE